MVCPEPGAVSIWRFGVESVFYVLNLDRRRSEPRRSFFLGGNTMAWKSPKIVEIALGAEINSYACAEAK